MIDKRKYKLVTFKGRVVSPIIEGYPFPDYEEIFHGIFSTNRWSGQGYSWDGKIGNCEQWNVGKHQIAVAFFSSLKSPMGFFKSLFHDYPEIFTGDIPTHFKTQEIRDFEEQSLANFAFKLNDSFRDFDSAAFMEYNYKLEDALMCDVESLLYMKTPPEEYFKEFCMQIPLEGEHRAFKKSVAMIVFNILKDADNTFLKNHCIEYMSNFSPKFSLTEEAISKFFHEIHPTLASWRNLK